MSTDIAEQTGDSAAAAEALKAKLSLQVKVEKPSACERRVLVVVAQDDVERYLKEAYDELSPKAEVPGFRIGKAPRKLIENRFKEGIEDQVKGKLIMDSMTQVSDEQDFSAISEPIFDFSAVTLKAGAEMHYEFKIEVRPEFDLPDWKGLKLERPTRAFTDADVDAHLKKLLARYSELAPTDETVQPGDIVDLCLTFLRDGVPVAHGDAAEVEVKPTLSLADAKIEGFDKLLAGKRVGDSLTTTVTVSADAENEALRGAEVEAAIVVNAVQHRTYPELTAGFLDRIGGFANEAELRTEVRKVLEKQLKYQQERQVRQQITLRLTVAADWDLPPDLLRRQARRELDRAVLDLQSNGFTTEQIQQHANELKRNILSYTSRSLKEHFILERIAEDEKLEVVEADFDAEIDRIADQNDESPRRVRARMEKKGLMDTLRNQIIERKVVELITSHADISETPYVMPSDDVSAVDFEIGAATSPANIPEALHSDAKELPGTLSKAALPK